MFKRLLTSGIGMSLVRHALTTVSGVLGAKGIIDADLAMQGFSFALGFAGISLSAHDKTLKQKQADLALVEAEIADGHLQEEMSTLQSERNHYKEAVESLPTEEEIVSRIGTGAQARYKHVSVEKNTGFMMSDASRKELRGVHPVLCEIAETAMSLCAVDFKITEGVRSGERQARLYKEGTSPVKESMHEAKADGFGYAVDVIALPTSAGSYAWEYYEQINDAMQAAAKIHGGRVTWGGTWGSRDGVHFQLDGMSKEAYL